MKKLVLILLLSSLGQAFAHDFTVTDQYNRTIPFASIHIQSENNVQNYYLLLCDQNGHAQADITIAEKIESTFGIKSVYPNPFQHEILLWYAVDNNSEIIVQISNIRGQLVMEKNLGIKQSGEYYFSWNAEKLPHGMYILALINGRKRESTLILKQDEGFSAPAGIPSSVYDSSYITKELFTVKIMADGFDSVVLQRYTFSNQNDHSFSLIEKNNLPFKTNSTYFFKWNGVGFDSLFIKGINLGISIPNTAPGELAASYGQYADWLDKIAETGFNSIRTYTLHYPHFYEAFYHYNITHPQNPLYLFQGVWLDETQDDTDDLYDLTKGFDDEIVRVVNAVHGNAVIKESPDRYGKATGNYSYNVSSWLAGYIIGREIHPFSVENTNNLNTLNRDYQGDHLRLPNGSPAEAWLTERMDNLISYENQAYKMQHPVCFSNWPTLDPMEHPTENDITSTEDIESIDLSTIETTNAPAGVFASYHAYPYFPDFINRDTAYLNYKDSYGANGYLGYLHDLKTHYHQMPLIIGEFGLPTSWGNAHFSQSGMHHGAITEVEQGRYTLRMFDNMYQAGCAGGMLFSWLDEWFKTSWITQEFDSTVERRIHWNNKLNPEQNFGLIAFETEPEKLYTKKNANTSCGLKTVRVKKTDAFFIVDIETDAEFTLNDTLLVGFDTYKKDVGEALMFYNKKVSNRAEFMLEIVHDTSRFYVTRAYDLFGIWHKTSDTDQLFHTVVSNGAPWNIFRIKTNFEDDAIHYVGKLHTNQLNNLNAVELHENTCRIKIPWGMLQFIDPSSSMVMDDKQNTPWREQYKSDGIALTIYVNSCSFSTERIKWNEWDYIDAKEREKESLQIIRNGIHQIAF